jgi:hypothetical protein
VLTPAQIRQGSLPVSEGLVDHFLGWIEPDDPRTQFGCQHLGKAPGAAAKVHDRRDGGPVDMGR